MKKNLLIVLLVLASCKNVIHPLDGSYDSGSSSDVVSASIHPNIILILGDDIGYEIPTCDSGQSYQTPNIDLLANRGMRFNYCEASPLCSPSRFMLLTGKYNFRNYTQWGIMDPGQKTIANMLKDAGYKTYVAGKWQLGGGDASIHGFGFDDYVVYNPFTESADEEGSGSRYKNPQLYKNGAYVDANLTLNKYSDDIFTDSIMNFMENNAGGQQPFFIYYSLTLCHPPFSPTPDDPEFAAWDPNLKVSDSKYYPSMVKYMDKKIGMIVNKIKSLGLINNTVIIYTGDNGTKGGITSVWNNINIPGGKSKTIEYGTHVPLIIRETGTIQAGSVNDDLIDFTDFLPTLAGIANIPAPTNYGPLDGISFAPRLMNQPGTPRDWIFCHYSPLNDNQTPLRRWVRNKTYKLYDSTGYFYNISKDIKEKTPMKQGSFTRTEDSTRQQFLNVFSMEHN